MDDFMNDSLELEIINRLYKINEKNEETKSIISRKIEMLKGKNMFLDDLLEFEYDKLFIDKEIKKCDVYEYSGFDDEFIEPRIAVAIDATQSFFIDNHLKDFIEKLPNAYEYHVITFDTQILDMSVFNDKTDILKMKNKMLIGSGPCLSVVKTFMKHNKYNKIYIFSDGYFVDDCKRKGMIMYKP